MIRYLRRLHDLESDESGAAMTEFIIFLPVWGFLFAGIFALAELNMETTRVQLMANKQVWDAVIPITKYSSFSHATQADNLTAANEHRSQAGEDGNDGSTMDYAEAVIRVAAADGHWTESFARVKPYELASIAEIDDLTKDPEDIVGDHPYALMIVDDQTSDGIDTGGGVGGIIAEILSASGITHATTAGIRYGTVFGEVDDHEINVAGGLSFSASAHYDALVAPAPMTGFVTKTSWGVARLMAETEDNYSVMMNYGESEWPGNASGDAFVPDTSEYTEEAEEKEEEAREEQEEFCNERDSDGNLINAGHERCN